MQRNLYEIIKIALLSFCVKIINEMKLNDVIQYTSICVYIMYVYIFFIFSV